MIKFKKINYKNFLSQGNNLTEIILDKHQTTLITGLNGNGKTTILDALAFVLYNKSFRKANKAALINWKNGKDCLVSVEFEKNGRVYNVKRGMRPNVFEIYLDDVLVNQDADSRDYQSFLEENILGMNFSIFMNTVLIGKQSYQSFFKFSTGERRKFVENILSLNIFSIMSDLNKQKINNLKQTSEKIKTDTLIVKNKLDYTAKYLKKIQSEFETKQKELNTSKKEIIETNLLEIEKFHEELKDIDKQLENISVDANNLSSITKRIETFNGVLIKAEMRISQIETENERIKSEDVCHSCQQEITLEKKHEKLEKNKEVLLSIKNLQEDAKNKLEINLAKQTQIVSDIETVRNLEQNKNSIFLEIEKLNKNNFNLSQTETELDDSSIVKEKEALKELLTEYQSLLESKDSILSLLEKTEFISSILSDSGIKASIIRQYLPVFVQTFNSYILKFGFNVTATFNEQFEESFFVNGFQEQNYFNFSAGEQIRLDIAMLMTMRYLTKIQKNSDCNVLMLDEMIDGSLDEQGVDGFIDIIKEQQGLNLFIISHNHEKYGSVFDRELVFSKTNGFSEMLEK